MKTFNITCLKKIGAVAVMTLLGGALPSYATVVNFEDQPAGPSFFSSASPIPQIIVSQGATFTGGVLLTKTSALPADQTTLYGSASFVSGMSNPMIITNPNGFNNFFFDLFNGLTTPTSYRVSDNNGHSQDFLNILPNTSSGAALVGFAATGTQVTIQSISPGDWDFFIDNINFDVPLPPSLSAPEVSSTLWLLAAAFTSMALVARLRRETV